MQNKDEEQDFIDDALDLIADILVILDDASQGDIKIFPW